MVVNQREMKDHFVRIAVGFEIGGWHDDDLVVVCVLHQLLGGGSSFSAGGPGKGMYTRLYTEVGEMFDWPIATRRQTVSDIKSIAICHHKFASISLPAYY